MVKELMNGLSYFAPELDELHYTVAGAYLTVTLEVGTNKVLQEKYVPAGVDNGVTLYDVGELIQLYMMPGDPVKEGPHFLDPAEVSLTTMDSAGAKKVMCKCYYGRRWMQYSKVKPLLLTHESERKTAAGRLEYISYMQDNATSVKVMAAVRQGEVMKYQQALVFDIDPKLGRIHTRDVSLAVVAAALHIAPEMVAYYDVYLYEGTRKGDKVRFVNDGSFYKHINEFLFVDAWGMPQTMTLTGLTEYAPELQGEVVAMLNRISRQDSRFEDVRTVNSGYLDKARYDCLTDMVTSPYLYMRDGEEWVPVVVEEVDFAHKSVSNEKINVQLTVRRAGKNQLGFSRHSAINPRIFDKSFDISFD